MDDCIFCAILAGREPASFVYRDERCATFLDTRPVNPGHLLVVPIRHTANLSELDPEDGAQTFRVAQWLAAALRRSGVRCEGVNLHLADGEVADQEVFHVHLHVVPRFQGDGFGLCFPPGYGHHPPREELDEIARRVKSAMKNRD